MILNNNELKQIVAGASFSSTLVKNIISSFNTFMDIGRYFGSSLRRIIGGRVCSL